MTKPWEEDWEYGRITPSFDTWYVRSHTGQLLSNGFPHEVDARLIAAAPAMARALAMVEWEGWNDHDECPYCGEVPQLGHGPACVLDAALTQAGLSPADREAVRKAGK
jgi:hypothetical protein